MTDVKKLLAKIAAEEERQAVSEVVAPVSAGGRVRARVAGLVSAYVPEPADFEGVGVFRLMDGRAHLIAPASDEVRAQYFSAFAQLSLILVRPLGGKTWAALPAQAGDFAQRVGPPIERRVHLVERGAELDLIRAAWDGSALWWSAEDRRADPREAEALRRALGRGAPYEALPGHTPELARAYAVAGRRAARAAYEGRRRDRAQIEAALEVVNGTLREFRDEGEGWQVEWTTDAGRRMSSWIDKEEPFVEGAAASVDATRRELDLRSLRGVVERAYLDGQVVDFD